MIPRARFLPRVENAASFPGGIEGFSDYLGKNLKYPATARKTMYRERFS
jgi:hypothetical protein